MSAVVLLSGGLDSATALYQAFEDGHLRSQCLAVSFRYGSIHMKREMQSAADIVSYAGVDHVIVDLPFEIFKGSGSALLGETAMPKGVYQDAFAPEGPSPTVVPFRNAVMLSMACALAQARGYSTLYAGMHASDHDKWAYPDCSPEFLGAFANAAYVGTMHEVRFKYPFVWMSKSDVVTRAALLDVPAIMTYSCYSGREAHCGVCPTCVERIQAFRTAGYIDPADYEIKLDWTGETWLTL